MTGKEKEMLTLFWVLVEEKRNPSYKKSGWYQEATNEPLKEKERDEGPMPELLCTLWLFTVEEL